MTRGERRWTLALIAVGAVLRLIEFSAGRGFWYDEQVLLSNISERPLPALLGHMSNAQLAPVGFLIVERWSFEWWGSSHLGLRVWPLLGSLAALALTPLVARRRIGPRAALLALAVMAFSGDLIYYASELKPYSTDVTATLLGLLATGWLDTRRRRVPHPSAVAAASVLGAVLIWFSFPAVLVLGSAGGWRILRAIGRRDRARVLATGIPLACWAVSAAAMLAVARGQTGPERVLWQFWDIAFVPRPIASRAAISWLGSRLVFLFANPLDTWTPLGYAASTVVPILLAILGLVALGRRRPGALFDLIGPVAAALAVAALRRYPFHGRLVLFLVPCLIGLIASGAASVRRFLPRGRARSGIWWILVASLLLFPAIEDLNHAIEPGRMRYHHPLGDLRPASLMPNHFP